jgi:hypothetical protein
MHEGTNQQWTDGSMVGDFNIFSNLLRTMILYQKQSLWIFENLDYESKNRPGNHQGVFLFVMTTQHWYFVQ